MKKLLGLHGRFPTLLLFCLGFVGMILMACMGTPGPAGADAPPAAVDLQETLFVTPGPGLHAEIIDVDLSDSKPAVTLRLTDNDGRPLTPTDLEGYGFTIAQIVQDEETGISRFRSLLVHEVTGEEFTVAGEIREPALATAVQAYADNGGE